MTSAIPCVMNNGRIVPLDPERLAKWKASHKQGEVFDMILDDGTSAARSPMALKYFAIRDEYMALNGYTKDEAHIELKHLFGVTYNEERPVPEGRRVRKVNYHGMEEWQLSIADYTTEELKPLVSGADKALAEAGI